jgi:hypothetical protein
MQEEVFLSAVLIDSYLHQYHCRSILYIFQANNIGVGATYFKDAPSAAGGCENKAGQIYFQHITFRICRQVADPHAVHYQGKRRNIEIHQIESIS